MKNILITGANSYIGNSFARALSNWPDIYNVHTIDMIDGTWRKVELSEYNTIIHVAGIAHIKETVKNEDLYYRVNRDLAVETAQKAKRDGVKHFIFLSSMSVYGMDTGIISRNTVPEPKSHYGKSKLQAEEEIRVLSDDRFKVAIIRPPMVYGKGCKGNYQVLAKVARKLPIFPDIKNKRSMIFIDNLSEFVRKIIDDERSGLFLPQNKDYVCTSEMVKQIALANSKNIKLTKIFNPLLMAMNSSFVKKIFGDLVYEMDSNVTDQVDEFETTIRKSEQ